MDSYEALAASYDELTEDVDYERRADFVERLFLRAKHPVKSLLDLACGTGTMTALFARRGYAVTGVSGCWERSTPRSAASTASTI